MNNIPINSRPPLSIVARNPHQMLAVQIAHIPIQIYSSGSLLITEYFVEQ